MKIKETAIIVLAVAFVVTALTFTAITTAGEITGGREFVPDGTGGWLVDGTPAAGRDLVGISQVLRDEAREQARVTLEAQLVEIRSGPSANPEIARLEAALLAVIAILDN